MSPIVSKKGERFTLPSKYLLLILTILCAGLMILSLSTEILDKPLNAISGYIITPFQKGITTVGIFLNERSEQLIQINQLLRENEELKEQVAQLTIENTQLQQDKYELNSLRELYQIDSQYEEYEKIGARIISREAGNWYHSFLIDKGSNAGIMKDMNVIANGGLVGRVTSVGPNWAKVMSIISDNSNVSGKVLATGDDLIVSGDLELMDEGNIRFEKLIDSKNKVAVGDKIVTSSISDKFLPNILLGYISDITVDSNNLTKSGKITPAVDFEHLEEVLIILELKQTVEESEGS